MEDAERCDRVGILHEGKLVALGAPDALKQSIGGDIVVIQSPDPHGLQRSCASALAVKRRWWMGPCGWSGHVVMSSSAMWWKRSGGDYLSRFWKTDA